MKRYSHPMNPGSRSTIRRAKPWADCMIEFGVRKYRIIEERHKLFGYQDTSNFAKGLTMDGHSSLPSSASEA